MLLANLSKVILCLFILRLLEMADPFTESFFENWMRF